MTVINTERYAEHIRKALSQCLIETNFKFGKRYQGKVRDTYDVGDKLILISNDVLC